MREGDPLRDPGVDGGIILKSTFEQWEGGMDLIDMAQDGDRWRDHVNVVMNVRNLKMRESS